MTTMPPDADAPSNSPTPAPPQWADGTRLAGLLGLFVGAMAVALFVSAVRDVLLMGFLCAFLLYGPIRRIGRRWPGRPILGVALVYGGTALVLGVLVFKGAAWLVDQAAAWAATMQQTISTIGAEAPPPETASLLAALQTVGLDQVLEAVANLHMVSSALTSAIGLVAIVATGLFFAFFLELHFSTAKGALRVVVPPAFADEVGAFLRQLDGLWVGYLQAMVIYCALLTLGSLVLFVVLGVHNPVIMAVFNGLITLIPSIGGIIGSIVTAAVCLAFGSTRFTDMSPATFAALVLVLHMVLVQVTYNFIALPIIGRFVRLPVWAVLVGVLASLAWGSILVAFLIPPAFGTIRLVGGYVLAKVQRRPPFPAEALAEPATSGFFSRLFLRADGPASTTPPTGAVSAASQR
jgi:predicted PurR-regulated permease PerM